MKITIVGGIPNKKASSVINKLTMCIEDILDKHKKYTLTLCNGTTLPNDVSQEDLIIWAPDIDNEEPKNYPVKGKGSVLICSKVMREGYTLVDAVSRIFNMHGNAVIAIHKDNTKEYRFQLIDALGNTWVDTKYIPDLCNAIMKLYKWTKESVRISLSKAEGTTPPLTDYDQDILHYFMELNRDIACKVANQSGNRYFGNYSTRCTKLFPSMRHGYCIFMSPRNVNKEFIDVNDIVPIYNGSYLGDRKPSIDAPIQIEIYNNVHWVNYLIHGHAYIDGAPTTEHYYPCGDMREAPEVISLLKDDLAAINLKNHGFLIASSFINQMEELISGLHFKPLQTI